MTKAKLIVSLKSATGVLKCDVLGKSDPFCKLQLEVLERKQAKTSSIQYKTLDPIWNETFTFDVRRCDMEKEALLIRMEDKDRLMNDFMGAVRIPFEDILSEQDKVDMTFPLLDKNYNDDKPRGEIDLGFKWVDSRDTAQAVATATGDQTTQIRPRKAPVLPYNLTLEVMKAVKLKNTESDNHISNVVCRICRTDPEPLEYQTSAIEDTCDPEWKEQFDFWITSHDTRMQIFVEDQQTFRTTIIGRIEFGLLDRIERNEKKEHTFVLGNKQFQPEHERGSIQVGLQAHGRKNTMVTSASSLNLHVPIPSELGVCIHKVWNIPFVPSRGPMKSRRQITIKASLLGTGQTFSTESVQLEEGEEKRNWDDREFKFVIGNASQQLQIAVEDDEGDIVGCADISLAHLLLGKPFSIQLHEPDGEIQDCGGIALELNLLDQANPELDEAEEEDTVDEDAHSTADLSPPFTLELTIVNAKNLKACDRGGENDAFCKIEWTSPTMNEVFKTPAISNTLNPEWNFRHTVSILEDLEDINLAIEVKDQDTFRDDSIGKVIITLAMLVGLFSSETCVEQTYSLQDSKKQSTGEITLRYRVLSESEDVDADSPEAESTAPEEVAPEARNVHEATLPFPYILEILLLRGIDLLACDGSTSTPFCTISLKSITHGTFKPHIYSHQQSSVKQKTLNPEWHEAFSFFVDDPSINYLSFCVQDKDLVGADFIGIVDVPLHQELQRSDPIQLPLLSKKHQQDKPRGSLEFQVRYHPVDQLEGEEAIIEDTSSIYGAKTQPQVKFPCVLKLTVLRARNLKCPKMFRHEPDAFCAAFVQPRGSSTRLQEQKTNILTKMSNPVFNATLEFDLENLEALELVIQVQHHDFLFNEFIGMIVVDSLSEDCDLFFKKITRIEQLRTKKKSLPAKDKSLGALEYSIEVVPKEDDAAEGEESGIPWLEEEESVEVDPTFSPNELHVTVLEAQNLRSTDMDGFSDPLCELYLESAKSSSKFTNVREQTLNPQWNESFVFNVGDEKDHLYVRVFDQDRISREFLGICQIPLQALKSGISREHWFPLLNKKCQRDLNFTKGKLHLQIQWKDVCKEKELQASTDAPTTVVTPSLDVAAPATTPFVPNQLHVNVRQAKDLLGKDSFSRSSDPLVILQCGESNPIKRTKVLSKTLSPCWNEHFEFDVVDPSVALILEVQDNDLLSNDSIGKVHIQLAEYASGELHCEWHALDPPGSGSLEVAIQWKMLEREKGHLLDTARSSTREFGYLFVHVFEAVDVQNVELLGENSPYVDIAITPGHAHARTQTLQHAGMKPKWNESLRLPWIRGEHCELQVQVFDEENLGKDKLIGQAFLELLEIPFLEAAPDEAQSNNAITCPEEGKQEWIELRKPTGKQASGQVRIALAFQHVPNECPIQDARTFDRGILRVYVFECRRVKRVQKFGQQDLYAAVQFRSKFSNDKEHKSKWMKTMTVEDGDTCAHWNTCLEYELSSGICSCELECRVYNDNLIKDQLLGSYSINLLKDWKSSQWTQAKGEWLNLFGTEGKTGDYGQMRLALQFLSQPATVSFNPWECFEEGQFVVQFCSFEDVNMPKAMLESPLNILYGLRPFPASSRLPASSLLTFRASSKGWRIDSAQAFGVLPVASAVVKTCASIEFQVLRSTTSMFATTKTFAFGQIPVAHFIKDNIYHVTIPVFVRKGWKMVGKLNCRIQYSAKAQDKSMLLDLQAQFLHDSASVVALSGLPSASKAYQVQVFVARAKKLPSMSVFDAQKQIAVHAQLLPCLQVHEKDSFWTTSHPQTPTNEAEYHEILSFECWNLPNSILFLELVENKSVISQLAISLSSLQAVESEFLTFTNTQDQEHWKSLLLSKLDHLPWYKMKEDGKQCPELQFALRVLPIDLSKHVQENIDLVPCSFGNLSKKVRVKIRSFKLKHSNPTKYHSLQCSLRWQIEPHSKLTQDTQVLSIQTPDENKQEDVCFELELSQELRDLISQTQYSPVWSCEVLAKSKVIGKFAFPLGTFFQQTSSTWRIERDLAVFDEFEAEIGTIALELTEYAAPEAPSKIPLQETHLSKKLLNIEIVRAKGLKNVEIFGKQDPFVQLQTLRYQRQASTRVIVDSGVDARWDETFQLQMEDIQYDGVKLTIKDKERIGAARSIGLCVVAGEVLSNGSKDSPIEKWIPVYCPSSQKVSGELLVRLSCEDVISSQEITQEMISNLQTCSSKSSSPLTEVMFEATSPYHYVKGPGELHLRIDEVVEFASLEAQSKELYVRLRLYPTKWENQTQITRGGSFQTAFTTGLHWSRKERRVPILEVDLRESQAIKDTSVGKYLIQLAPYVLHPAQVAVLRLPLRSPSEKVVAQANITIQYLPLQQTKLHRCVLYDPIQVAVITQLQYQGQLDIHVVKAHKLRQVASSTTAAPYVHLKLLPLNLEARSRIDPLGQIQAEWNQHLIIDLAQATPSTLLLLVAEVWTSSEKVLLGRVEIPLFCFVIAGGHLMECTFPLIHNSKTLAGQLTLACQYFGHGMSRKETASGAPATICFTIHQAKQLKYPSKWMQGTIDPYLSIGFTRQDTRQQMHPSHASSTSTSPEFEQQVFLELPSEILDDDSSASLPVISIELHDRNRIRLPSLHAHANFVLPKEVLWGSETKTKWIALLDDRSNGVGQLQLSMERKSQRESINLEGIAGKLYILVYGARDFDLAPGQAELRTPYLTFDALQSLDQDLSHLAKCFPAQTSTEEQKQLTIQNNRNRIEFEQHEALVVAVPG